MVDSQDLNLQPYQQENQHQQHQANDESDAAVLISQIPTADLMSLGSDMMELESFQDVGICDSLLLNAIHSGDGNLLLQATAIEQPMNNEVLYDECSVSAPCVGEFKQEHQDDSVEGDSSMISSNGGSAAGGYMDRTPTLDDLCDPAYTLNVDLNGETSGKSSWMYSTRLNKAYVKMMQSFTVFISYVCNSGMVPSTRPLQVRAMLVCSEPEDAHHPVYRCDNHRCGDNTNPNLDERTKAHVMRCFNPLARYVGTEKGVAFRDRLAVIIPLGAPRSNNREESEPLSVSLEFVCQNSCRIINRRSTAVLFTLEDDQGRLLGKKFLNVKVCSCPKRDKQKEEQNLKRKPDEQLVAPAGKKIARLSSSGPSAKQAIAMTTDGKLAFIKKEQHHGGGSPRTPSPLVEHQHQRASTKASPVVRTLSGNSTGSSGAEMVDQTATVVSVPMPSVATAVKVAEYAFDVVSGELVRCADQEQSKFLAAYLTRIKRQLRNLKAGTPSNYPTGRAIRTPNIAHSTESD